MSSAMPRSTPCACRPARWWGIPASSKLIRTNDASLATVLAHEMAHALAHHASERVAHARSRPSILRSLAYTRIQEEADHIGAFLMTFAGYDPQEAVVFWEGMHRAA